MTKNGLDSSLISIFLELFSCLTSNQSVKEKTVATCNFLLAKAICNFDN